MFTTSCFIRKNTPELRYKLEELRYINGGKERTYGEHDSLYCNCYVGRYYECVQKPSRYESIIDCGDNEELFLALVTMRDDTDINRWFKDLETNELFICTKHSIYDMATAEDLEEYGDWIGIGMCKYQPATVKEIIEHFKNK